jgi:leucyl aminopeptidase
MHILPTTEKIDKIEPSVALFFTEEHAADLIKKDHKGYEELIASVIKDGDFKGERDQLLTVHTHGKIKAKHVILIGLGKLADLDVEKIRRAFSLVVGRVKMLNRERFAAVVDFEKIRDQDAIRAAVEGIVLADYKFLKYKTEDQEKRKEIREALLVVKKLDYAKDWIAETQMVCETTNFVRDLQNENADVMNSLMIEKVARDLAKRLDLKITVFDEKQLKKMGMNLLLAVGQGSRYPPRFIILEYIGNKTSKETTAIIGKGITFDSGGLNLKPTKYIETMRLDKSGAGVVLGVLKAAAELKLRTNVVGVIATCENVIGSGAYKPGDVFVSYAGKTVEIGNTDAEGRLILADALAYTEKNIRPTRMIDFATLTGAVSVCFGEFVAGMMGTDKELMKKLLDAGQRTYERVWELPLYDEYLEEVKGEVGDISNQSYWPFAGAIMGAAFLKKFVEKTPWTHVDIAGTAWWEKSRYYTPKSGTGFGVRLMVDYLKQLSS